MSTIDLRDREITTLDDFAAAYHEHNDLMRTGKMPPRDALITAEQRDSIYALLQNQAPGQATCEGEHLRWVGMTFTVA